MILSINYASGKFTKYQNINRWSAKYIAGIDKTICYGPEKIDTDFQQQNKLTFSNKRGSGLWLWKPYFIDKALSLISENDYLVYTDSGVFYYRKIQKLIDQLNASKQDVMLFDLPLIEIQWTKNQVFAKLDIFDDQIKYSNQRNGAIIIIKKSSQSVDLVKTWLKLCCDPDMLSPNTNKETIEHTLYIEHREDQSILSTLSKLSNIQSFSDPTEFSRLNYLYLSPGNIINKKTYDSKYLIKNIFFIQHRGKNLITYLAKFYIRYLLMYLIDPNLSKK